MKKELLVIGNGEDLGSTPDDKIMAWMVQKSLPIVMMTTTKTVEDKKGGQLVLVKGENDYIAIVEKAQAEKAQQLELFETMGLRESDHKSIFNTNIVLINKFELKKRLDEISLTEHELLKVLAPDLIKNTKKQDGKEFVQLEGAIGSCLLNMDKYFRLNFGVELVGYLNLDSKENREKFFMPLKTREDFERVYGDF